jgi:hypothetical protein
MKLMDDLIPKVFDRAVTAGTVPKPAADVITCEFIVRPGGGHLARRSQHHMDADSRDHMESLQYVREGADFKDMSAQPARVAA